MNLGTYRFTGGYNANEPELLPVESDNDVLAFGSENLLYQGGRRLESFRGLTATNPITGGRTMFNFSDGYASLNDYDPGSGNVQGLGSIFISYAKTLWFVGAGKVYANGVDLSATATSTLSFRKLTGGSYAGTTLSAGLAQPSAPTVAARTASFGAGLTGLLNGTFSVRITRIRSTSGGESVASLPSAVVSVTNGTLRITFPALDANGQDRWGIYVTQAGFGATGPYFLLREISDADLSTIDGIARSYEAEWADGGVLPILVPTDNYPPPACTHAVQLEDVTCAIGCYGDTAGISATSPGNGVAYSLPGFPEAFPPDNLQFLPEAPVYVLNRPAQRYAYVLMKNSVAAITYTGGETAISVETIWDNIGCAAPHQAVDVDGRLYAFAGGKLVRMGLANEPEDAWSDPIARHVRDFTAGDVVLGYDSKLKTLCVMHGSTIYPFHVPTERWGAPCNAASFATGTMISAVTVNNGLKLTVKNGSVFSLYDFHVGAGVNWKARSNWADRGDSARKKTIFSVTTVARFDNTTSALTVNLYRNAASGKLDTTTPAKSWTRNAVASTGTYSHRAKRINVRNARQFCLELIGGLGAPVSAAVEGETHELI